MSVTDRNTEAARVPSTRRTAKAPAILMVLLYFAAVFAPLLTALVLGKRGRESFAYEVGLSVALVGFAMLLMQFVLASRAKWLDRDFEMGLVYQFHRATGMIAGALLLAHPLLLAAARRGWPLLIGLHQHLYIWIGRGALLVLLLLAVQAAFRARLHLEYQKWQISHSLLSVAVLVSGFLHVMQAGGDWKLAAIKVLWFSLAGTAVLAYAWRRLGLPASLRKQAYRVTDVRQEAADVFTVTAAPPPGEPVPKYLPGQYQYLTFRQEGGLAEEHPFTLSSSPTEPGILRSTIKGSGDFTKTIGKVRPGDTVLSDAPYGRFSYLLHPDENSLVFLAGGIGVTPFISMLRHLRDTQTAKDVLLLYANQTEGDLAFRDELAGIEAGNRPNLSVGYFLSKPGDGWQGETGRINEDALRRLVPDISGKGFYLCGPPPFIKSLASALRQLGVPVSRIYYESFSQ